MSERMTIAEFLLARIADDEAITTAVKVDHRANYDAPISTDFDAWPSERAFAEHVTPGRVLAECEAKRKIIELADEATGDRGLAVSEFSTSDAEDEKMWADDPGEGILRSLAAVYADHPDFRKTWATATGN